MGLCASWSDARLLVDHRTVYVEHGAGQTYVGGNNEGGRGYAGADELDHVVLFLTPGDDPARRWRARYPQAVVESVGNPSLDQHLHAYARSTHVTPTVVVTEHWRCGVAPETMPALPRFDRGIRELARLGDIQLVGHAHPRGDRRTRIRWEKLGVDRFEHNTDWVLRNADLLVADNTSLMYEAAALDVPVLALNGPEYRRDVEHGLRFWSHVPGIQCSSVGTFIPAVMAALDDPPEARSLRARAAMHVYAHRDGRSAERAADAIEDVIG